MAATFTRKASRNVGTSLTAVGGYTVGGGVTTTAIGLTLCNTTGAAITVSATLNDGVNDTYIVKDAPVLPGAALVAIGGDQKVVMLAGDSIKVSSNTASSLDAVLSVLEQS